MQLYERLKLTPRRVNYELSIKRNEARLRKVPYEVAVKNLGMGNMLCCKAWEYCFISLEAYLAEAHEVTREYVAKALPLYEDYFFGQWRDEVPSGNYRDQPPSREYQDIYCRWVSFWQDCLLWCSALGEWDKLIRFAEYPRDDVKLGIDQTPENRAWLLLVAGKLRGRPIAELQPFADTIVNGKRKREKLLMLLFEAILEEDSDDASLCLREYATYYKASEFPKEELSTKVACDASFLVHYAGYTDVTIEVPDKLRDHIVRLS